jgi:hypothetical protein
MDNRGIFVKRSQLKDMILEKWELMDPKHAIWYCTFLMVGSWVVFWAGVSQSVSNRFQAEGATLCFRWFPFNDVRGSLQEIPSWNEKAQDHGLVK